MKSDNALWILEYQVQSGVHEEDLWIESLDSDGQQFHQYQQNKVTSHLKSLNTKRPWHMALEIQILTWDRHTNMAEVNQLLGSQPYSLAKSFFPWK